MQQSPLTTRERGAKSSLALVSVFFIIILFGLFWVWQMKETTPPPVEPVGVAPQKEEISNEIDYSSLEASAVNTTIPSFESIL